MTYEMPANRCTQTFDADQNEGEPIRCHRRAGHDGAHAPTAEYAARLEAAGR